MIKIYTPTQCAKLCQGYTPDEFFLRNQKLGVYMDLVPTQPLYAHDPKVVLEAYKQITFPHKEKVPVRVFCVPYNTKGWFNGLTWAGTAGGGLGIRTGSIVLLGKTTPIPFSISRYIMVHEFGHAVQGLFVPRYHKKNEKWRSYLKFRQLPYPKDQNRLFTKPWHLDPGEIIADDFRILFSPYDNDFWPHDKACVHPSKVKGLEKFLITLLND